MHDRLRNHAPPPWVLIAATISLVPVGRMVQAVRRGSHTQYADYWSFIDGFFGADGGMALGELTRFQSQHLVSVPLVTYWVNMRLWGGSNITLGLVVVAVTVASVGLCWRWIAACDRLTDLSRVVLAVTTAALAFSPHGAWNFVRAMSGTAWWLANLLALLAITLAAARRTAPAIGVAILATFTYGTALLVWPALLVVLLLRHRSVRTLLPVAGASAVATGVYLALRERTASKTSGQLDPPSLLSDAATLVGGLLVDDAGQARLLGAFALIALVAVAVVAVRSAPEDAAPWAALGAFGAGNACLIAHSRGGETLSLLSGETVMLHGRYTSIAALTWIGILGLTFVALGSKAPRPLRALAVAVTLAVGLAASLGADPLSSASQDDLGDALRVDVAAGGPWLVFEPFPDLSPLLESIGHHPFDSRYDRGCGLLDSTIGEADTSPLPEDASAAPVATGREPRLPNAVVITTRVTRPGWDVECAAVADGDGAVIGVGRARDGDAAAIRAVAPTGADRYVLLVRFRQSERLYALPAADAP